ncbi:MAG: hypothetical protein Kow00121_62230 [Elainellaceae cyanobacterium]
MPKVAHFQARFYLIALLIDAIALLITWLLQPLIAPTFFALFYVAVMASSLYGGLGPGLFSTTLATLVCVYFFLPPAYSLLLTAPDEVFRLILLVSVALLICGLSSRYRRAKLRSEQMVLKLQESQELFESFMGHSPLTAFIKDESGRYLYVNPVVERQFNRPLAEWLGRTDSELFSDEAARPILEHDRTVLTTNQTLEIEETAPESGGSRHYMTVKFPLHDRSKNRMVAGMSLDITEWRQTQAALRESEARFHRLAETTLIGFLAWSLDGKILDANDAFLRLVGYSREELEAGQLRWDTMTPSGYQQADQDAIAELKRLGSNTPFEKEFIRKDGTRVPVLLGSTFLEQSRQEGVSFVLDLTERKQVQDALRESEERYRLLAEALPQLIWTTDAIGQVEYCNPYWYRYTGLTPEQTLGVAWRIALQPDDLRQLWLRWQQARQTGESFTIECRIRAADGQYRWFLASVGPVQSGEGAVTRWVGTAIDIEMSKRAESERNQLLAREQSSRAEAENERLRLQEFFLKAPAMIAFVRGRDYVYEFANPTYLQVAGRSAEQLIGKPLHEVFPEINSQGFFEIFDQVYDTGIPFSGTETPVYYDRGNDGTLQEAFFNFVYQPLRNASGEVEGILMHAIEVTAQVQARRQIEQLALQVEAERSLLETVLQQMPAGVIIAEAPSGKLILGNNQVERIWRHPFLASKEIEEYREYKGFHSDGRPYKPEEWPLARSLSTGEVITQEEIRFVRWDDTKGVMEVSSTPVRDRQGQIIAGVVTFQDISERKRSEQEREQLLAHARAARDDAEAANRIKDEFLAVLSHELRTPLNPILGWTKLLRTRNFDKQRTQQALEVIERNVALQAQLIEDLLDISRILRGKLKLEVCSVDLATTINAAIETVRLAAEAKTLQIHTHLQPNLRPVSGDSGRLQQVFWNILSNAVKFTPPGGQIHVRLEQVIGNGTLVIGTANPSSDINTLSSVTYYPSPTLDFAQITITDTGKGINPDFLPHVFDYFRQADGSTTRSFGGLGLGLAIARHLIELHGGTIAADSQGEGQGATFTVWLPLMAQAAMHQPAAPPTNAVNLRGAEVLVVDDEPDSRELIAVILADCGAKVTSVASASEALRVMEQTMPALLISDIGMAEMDGYELMRYIRLNLLRSGETLPAIALTAYAGEADQQRALAAGFQQHLAKPIEPNALVQAIAQLLSASRA